MRVNEDHNIRQRIVAVNEIGEIAMIFSQLDQSSVWNKRLGIQTHTIASLPRLAGTR